MYWECDRNAYYHPESLGLTVVASLEYSDLNYQFDTRVVWRHDDTGVLYTARDSGCSCPIPFEDYTTLDSLERVHLETLRDEVASELLADYSDVDATEARDFLRTVREALNG